MKLGQRTWGALFGVAVLASACGDANPDGSGLQRRLADSNRPPARAETPTEVEETTPPPASSPAPEAPPPEAKPVPEPDADADGVPDARDCDPQNAAVVGTKLLDDALAADSTYFAPATGFPTGSWAYATEAYRQARLVNGADATLFTKNTLLTNVDVTVAAASTEITSTITPRLRQMFVLVGARTDGDVFTAYGCGVEVVQGMSPEQQTSVVKLSGKPDAIVTTAIQRTPRNVLVENEGFSMRAQVKDGKITCTVSQGAGVVTTAEAPGIADAMGAIGFYTRQTKAAFKNVKACKLQ